MSPGPYISVKFFVILAGSLSASGPSTRARGVFRARIFSCKSAIDIKISLCAQNFPHYYTHFSGFWQGRRNDFLRPGPY